MNLILILIIITPAIDQASQVPSSCTDLIPLDYDTMQAPSNTTQAYIQQSIFFIGAIKIRDQTFVLKLRTVLDWADKRLIKSEKLMMYTRKRFLPKFQDCFWIPYIRIANLAGEEEVEKDKVLVLTNPSTGSMRLVRKHKLLVSCPIDMTWYPMDAQNCVVRLMTFAPDHVTLSWLKLVQINDTTRRESAYNVRVEQFGSCSHKYFGFQNSCLELRFHFKRRIGMYLMTVYFPSSLIVTTSFISFWIDPLSVPGRVTLTVTSLLALMTQFLSVRQPLHDVSRVTAIDVWFMGCILIVAMTMYEFAATHRSVFMASNSVSKFISSKNPHKKNTNQNFARNSICKVIENLKRENLDSISRTLFPLLFLFYATIYWMILCCSSR